MKSLKYSYTLQILIYQRLAQKKQMVLYYFYTGHYFGSSGLCTENQADIKITESVAVADSRRRYRQSDRPYVYGIRSRLYSTVIFQSRL